MDTENKKDAVEALDVRNGSCEPDLYEYLRKECPTLEAAKAWIWKWANEMEQCLPWERQCGYSSRAMAGHLSNVLEGGNYETGYATGKMIYFDTQYGCELYYAAWGQNPNAKITHAENHHE